MESRHYFRILVLIVLSASIFYLVWPKYIFYYRFESQSFVSRPEVWRANNITGKVEYMSLSTSFKWVTYSE